MCHTTSFGIATYRDGVCRDFTWSGLVAMICTHMAGHSNGVSRCNFPSAEVE